MQLNYIEYERVHQAYYGFKFKKKTDDRNKAKELKKNTCIILILLLHMCLPNGTSWYKRNIQVYVREMGSYKWSCKVDKFCLRRNFVRIYHMVSKICFSNLFKVKKIDLDWCSISLKKRVINSIEINFNMLYVIFVDFSIRSCRWNTTRKRRNSSRRTCG